MTPHPDFARFFNALQNNPDLFTPFQADVYRQTLPRFMSLPYRFTGVGSVLSGGRWGVQRLMPAVYASTDLQTLTAEAYYRGRLYGWMPQQFKTQLVVTMRWELQAVLDLTAPATLKLLKVKNAEILACDWLAEQSALREAITQAIARAAFENQAEGMVVPSARRSGGINVVYYPTHRRSGTGIQTRDEANIPFMHGL